MQSTKQSLTKSAETAKHEKKIEKNLMQAFTQKLLLIKQKIIKFLNGGFQSKPPKEMQLKTIII